MLVFSAVALYLTSFWNKGFIVDYHWQVFIKTVILVAFFFYIVLPITRLILLPINFLTLGLISTVVYFLLFYFFFTHFSLVKIKEWDFSGLKIASFILQPVHVRYIENVFLSSLSLSFIINMLGTIL